MNTYDYERSGNRRVSLPIPSPRGPEPKIAKQLANAADDSDVNPQLVGIYMTMQSPAKQAAVFKMMMGIINAWASEANAAAEDPPFHYNELVWSAAIMETIKKRGFKW